MSNLGSIPCHCDCGTTFNVHIPLGFGTLEIHCPICKKYNKTVEITGSEYSRAVSVSKKS